MNSLASITPKPTERMIIVGATGSGKTHLARQLFPAFDHIVCVDPIGMLGVDDKRGYLDDFVIARTPDELAYVGRKHSRLQYRPDVEYHSWEAYDAVFHWVFERTNTMLYNDEGFRVMRGVRAPEWLNACLTAGRQRGIGMITCTQRPTGLDLRLFSEAEHYVCFKLRKEADRRRMAEQMGDLVVKKPVIGHNFYYMNDDMKAPRMYVITE